MVISCLAIAVSSARAESDDGGGPKASAGSAAKAAKSPITGGFDLMSQYVQRGMTADPDSEGVALQPYLNIALPWGFFVGYWGSSLDPSPTGGPTPFENDLSLGWALDLGEAELRLGATGYATLGHASSNVAESAVELRVFPNVAGADLGALQFAARTMLGDSDWSHVGDTYLLLRLETPAWLGFSLTTDVGWHGYATGPRHLTTEKFAFRNVDLGAAYQVPGTGYRLLGAWTYGGVDRVGKHQPQALTWGAGWEF
jgi:uncharacterized protein (TIGR02001 family)